MVSRDAKWSAGPPRVEELVPAPDPWETARRLAGLPHLLFLDSADRDVPAALKRYSFVAADPLEWWQRRVDDPHPPAFGELQAILNENARATLPDLPPFQGGLA